jgi:nucleotide-binding universal stress UspA family protein
VAEPAALGRSVLVPIANPASAQGLLRHAAKLAESDGGTIHLVTVLRPDAPSDERAHAWQGLADAEEIARKSSN